MPTLTPPRTDDNAHPEHRSRRGWLLAAAVLAVVVLAVGGPFTMLGSLFDDVVLPPVATDPAADAEQAGFDQALEVSRAYIDARNAYDADRARELVSDPFTSSEIPASFTLNTMELAFELHEVYGFQYADGDCEILEPEPHHTPVEGEVKVACDYLWTSELHRIAGYPPVAVSFVFRVQDGLIRIINHDWNPDEFMPNVYDPWLSFLDRLDPEVEVNVRATHRLDPERTRAFIEQAPDYLALYEEWVEDQKG